MHGGDIYSHPQVQYDFSSNINPLGIPPEMVRAMEEGLKHTHRYPDLQYRALREALATYGGVSPQEVVVGNGVVDILDGAMALASSMVLVHPGFSEYEERGRIRGMDMTHVVMEEPFHLDVSAVEEALKPGALLVLASPNNPTGYTLSQEELLALLKAVKSQGGLLLLDEAFVEFTPVDYNAIDYIEDYPLLVCRGATKIFGLPGIRLGYGFTERERAELLSQRLLPWRINTLADEVGQLACHQEKFFEDTRNYVAKERARLKAAMEELGLQVYDSQANYLLIKTRQLTVEEIYRGLLERGILIRKCDNYRGLGEGFFRIAVRAAHDNGILIGAMEELFTEREK
ncbi:MAG: histidinol-phosphate transaminase [Tissierellia bacterium]|nr:histidinol-phosphate transaminase [Tissierellia bacterium]